MNITRRTAPTAGRRTGRRGVRFAAVALAGAAVVTLAPTAAVATAAGGGGSGPSAAAAAARTDLTPALRALVEPGGSTAALGEVRENGRRVWRDAAGVSDLDTGRPARADGRFRIGSVTKTFVATVVLQLVDEGRLRLDDPIERHLPGVVPNGGAISVRHLLNHTSGLFNYLDDPRFLFHDEASLRAFRAEGRWTTWSPAQLIEVGVTTAPYFAPGQGWHYSNTNYVLAGELIRKVTGHSWQSEVERRIVRPLHLADTTFPGSRADIPGPHAHAYAQLPEGPADITQVNPTLAGAAGNGISTTTDLTRFHEALFGGRLLSAARLKDMTTAVPAPTSGGTYGLGVARYELSCGEVWGHSGGFPGYSTWLLGSPDGARQFALSYTLPGPETDASDIALDTFIERAACGPQSAATATATATAAGPNSPSQSPR